MAAQRDSKGRFIKKGSKPEDAASELLAYFKGAKKRIPIVFESNVFEAAEMLAIHLDKATRFILYRNPTGTLANSWNAVLNSRVSAGAYSSLPYAAIHETGGVIRPSRAKALAVPLTRAARNAGSPRNMSGLKFIPGSGYGGGPPRLWNGQDQYVLLKSVTIPGRGYITLAAQTSEKDIEKILKKGAFEIFAGTGSVFEVS